ncbi:MAG: LVIVD repeat-containing protein, partial [Chitinophagales bacterium]
MKNRKNFNIISLGIFLMWLMPSLTYAQLNMTLEGELDYTQELSDIWGYTDGQGQEYAIVGVYNGVSIVDISTDPSNPTEVAFLSGVNITWRDIKIWGNYAYVINESSAASGLRIIDLSNLPASVTDTHSTLGVGFRDAHNIFIDENGIGYLFGSTTVGAGNVGQGTLMIDLNTDPLNPTYLGIYNTNYVHDAFVRGDTMWASEIYAGQVAVVDVSDKANPVILGTKDTPKDFAHACWPNDDNTVLYVLEEKQDAWVLAYDVSDVTDIQELDRYQSLPGTNVIPHNTFVINQNFVVNSYYTSGVVILDATHPH